MRAMLVTGFYPGERMGGAEYQTSLLAQGLVTRGHEVVFLATDAGRESTTEVDGITLWETPGWRRTGWAEHRRQVAQAIRETKPDICYVRLLTELANTAALCQHVEIPVVSASSSLREISPFLLGYYPVEAIGHLRSGRTVPHFRSFLAIRSSAAHVCNTCALQQKMRRWFHHKPIRMIYNGSPVAPSEEMHQASTGQVVWVNNLKRRKRPQLFVEVARRLPEFRFVMIGATPSGGRYARELRSMLQQAPANFLYLGPMPLAQVNTIIKQSDLLLYTSKVGAEGFGNSFLQAWLRGVPTVSLSFELDGILERENIGRFCATFEQLVAEVRDLMEDETARLEMGRKAREYAERHHSAERMVADYESLFQEILNGTHVISPQVGGS
jgi:glycosyltransferase involved in cell wall biosynthesis